MKPNIIDIFNTVAPLSTGLEMVIQNLLKPMLLKQGDFLIQPGQVSDKIYFLEQGLVVSYHLDNCKEVCNWAMKEGDIVISVYSFFSQQPAEEYIQAAEDCNMQYITHQELEQLYTTFPEFNYIGRKITERYYMLNEQRAIFLRKYTAQERVALFLSTQPEFSRRLSATQLASYLGMSREEFSRQRSAFLKKK